MGNLWDACPYKVRGQLYMMEGLICILHRCNILICFHFPVHTNEIPICECLHVCTVHYLAYTAQPKVHVGMGQLFTFARDGVMDSCASQNAAPECNMNETRLLSQGRTCG